MQTRASLNEVAVSSRLLDLIAGAWMSQAIYVVAKLGIADLLENGPASSEALAERSGTHPDVLRRLLLLLSSRGIFQLRPDGQFEANSLSEGLRSSARISLRHYSILLGEEPYWSAWGHLLHTAKTGEAAFQFVHGTGLYPYLESHPDTATTFDAAITGRARQENEDVVASYTWPAGLIVDVGGGQGTLLAAILRKQPAATGLLFEVPSVAARASETLAEEGAATRSTVVAGDMFEAVPPVGDLYILRRVLHGWRDEDALRILRRCRAAMKPESILLVIEHVLDPDNRPTWGQMLDLQMLVLNPGGRERREEDYRYLLSDAGFVVSRLLKTETVTSLIEATPKPP
ncbi:methyltransferase [Alsobacter sp. SYSU BS001988]